MPKNSKSRTRSLRARFVKVKENLSRKLAGFLQRRPHRSFQLSRKRDYARSLAIPGYFSLTAEVHQTLKQHKKIFLSLGVVYALLTAVVVGVGSQDLYATLSSTLRDTGSQLFQGDFSQLEQASLLFIGVVTTGLTGSLTDIQQVYSIILALLVWLTTVWLLRQLLAGKKVRMRDGLYSAGAPIVPSFLVTLVLVLQLVPVALAVIGYSAAVTSGLLEGGVEAMLFWIAAGGLGLLSLYWITATFIALIIVTLPGMYPFEALRTAGDIVVGRRVRILLRLLWLFLLVVVSWALILIPMIIFDGWIKSVFDVLQPVPFIPIALMILSTATVVWTSAYVYILYRKVVSDDAKPA